MRVQLPHWPLYILRCRLVKTHNRYHRTQISQNYFDVTKVCGVGKKGRQKNGMHLHSNLTKGG